MAAREETGMEGLKRQAEASLFSDLKVTPEMKERLKWRIRERERRKQGQSRGRWAAWSVAAAVAALAVSAPLLSGPLGMEQVGRNPGPAAEDGRADRTAAERPAATPAKAPPQGMQFTLKAQSVDQEGAEVAPESLTRSTNTAAYAIKLTATDASGNALTGTSGSAVTAPEIHPGRKIILNADYALEVQDARLAMSRLQQMTASTGGYVVEANLNQNGDGSWTGRMVARIPSLQYESAVNQVRTVGEVKSERQWSRDVTEQYMDLESRIRIESAHEQKLQELAGKAASFDDWLKLTQRINETRAQIERMEGQIKLLANQVEFSTLTIGLTQPAPGQAEKQEQPKGLLGQMGDSFREIGRAHV